MSGAYLFFVRDRVGTRGAHGGVKWSSSAETVSFWKKSPRQKKGEKISWAPDLLSDTICLLIATFDPTSEPMQKLQRDGKLLELYEEHVSLGL